MKGFGPVHDRCIGHDDANALDIQFAVAHAFQPAQARFVCQAKWHGHVAAVVDVADADIHAGLEDELLGQGNLDACHDFT
jgi:hypothetical protein